MRSTVVSIAIPEVMLRKIDEAARADFQTRSNFIRMCVVKHFGAKSQWELEHDTPPPRRPTGKELWEESEFKQEYDEMMKYLEQQEGKQI
jgi:hypothetical protein